MMFLLIFANQLLFQLFPGVDISPAATGKKDRSAKVINVLEVVICVVAHMDCVPAHSQLWKRLETGTWFSKAF